MNKNILLKAENEHCLSKEEIMQLFDFPVEELCLSADNTRKKYKGNAIHLRGLIEFTNICKRNCFYCGLRCANTSVKRYRMTEAEIISQAKICKETGIKTIVLQGGEDDYFTQNRLCRLIEKIKNYDVALTLSIGEKSYNDYRAFKQAGADRYLLRIETTDENLYKNLHPNMNYKNRIECLYNLKELGYETGSGSLVGLPNQNVDSLAEDILFFKQINADMIGIGPFIPHKNTPLANANSNNFELALKTMAITRLLLPDINIPATTAMETLKKDGRKLALNSGANVVMPNMTGLTYSEKYEIYPNKTATKLENVKNLIKSLNRTVSETKGFRKDK